MSKEEEAVRIDGYKVIIDDYGNMQLCCVSQLRSGKIYLDKDTVDKFSALSHTSGKLIWFSDRVAGVDACLYLEELDELQLSNSDGGRPHYLFGSEDMKRHPRRSWRKAAWV